MAIANITNNILTDSGIATSSLVPYTGATANVNLGNFNFDANEISGAAIIAKLNGPASSPFVLKSGSSGYTIGNDAISLISSPNVANTLILASNIGVVTKTAQFGLGSLTATRTFTLPDSSGTIALTSNLSAYLPLTGGTLTGPLSGTTADFSGLGTFYQLTMTGATAGRIFYAQTGGVVSQSGNLNWNETNGMLGVGTPNPSAVITAFSNNAATQFKASGNAPAFTFSESLTTSTRACVFGLATAANQFITGTAAGDMAIANQSTVAGAIVFGTGTAEKMRMSSSGNFGIGTSSPSSLNAGANQLVVGNGSSTQGLTIYTGSASDGNIYFANGTTGSQAYNGAIVYNHSSNYMIFATNGGTERMRITSGGDVGIGNSGFASTRLTVSGKDNTSSNYAFVANNASNSNLFLVRNDGAAIVNGVLDLNSNTTPTTVNDKFGLGVNGSSYAWIQSFGGRSLVLQSQGNNVLIGTTTDNGSKLQIVNGASQVGLHIKLGATNSFSAISVVSSSNVAMLDYSEFGFFRMYNALSVPNSNFAGGSLYVENGALKFRGSNGTITTIANA